MGSIRAGYAEIDPQGERTLGVTPVDGSGELSLLVSMKERVVKNRLQEKKRSVKEYVLSWRGTGEENAAPSIVSVDVDLRRIHGVHQHDA